MSEVRDDRQYTKDHEWAKRDGDVIVIGITAHAQDALGDVTFVELPEVEDELSIDEEFGEVESNKSVSKLISPISGEVTEINEELEDTPELVNEACYDAGWMIKLRPSDVTELEGLMSADEYRALLG